MDLNGFGRRNIVMKPDEIYDLIVYQVGALSAFVKAEGGRLQHVKPHGALYNMAAKDQAMSEAIAKPCTMSTRSWCCSAWPAAGWSKPGKLRDCRRPARYSPTGPIRKTGR